MTKEEAISRLKKGESFIEIYDPVWDEALKVAISALSENKSDPIECARTLRQHCIDAKNCKECFMWDECKYELSAPCDWDLPDGEKGGE